jgi:hypothetical protein
MSSEGGPDDTKNTRELIEPSCIIISVDVSKKVIEVLANFYARQQRSQPARPDQVR